MRLSWTLRWLFIWATIVSISLPRLAFAKAVTRESGRIQLTLPSGAVGPLVLTSGQGGWIGEFTVTNLGAEPLGISRVAIRGDEDDVRSPSRLGAHFVDGTTSATLAPGASKNVAVAWMPPKDPHIRQALGHVVVTSTDEQAGEVAMGFRAQLPTGLGWIGAHVLSLLVALPLLIVLMAGVALILRREDDAWIERAAIVVWAVVLLLALWAWMRFVPDVTAADGNDGFQLVERLVWIRSLGAEWYVGVDGVSISLVVLVAVVAFASLIVAPLPGTKPGGYLAAHALVASATMAMIVALDAVVLLAAFAVTLVSLALLVGGWGSRQAGHAATKFAIYGAVSFGALLLVVVALSQVSGHTFLVDGSPLLHTFAIPEFARTAFAAKGTLLGFSFVAVVWTLLFVAVAILTPVVPLHGWLADVLEEAPAGGAILIGGAVVAIGPYLLVRLGLGAMAEGAAWAGPSMAALGAFSAGFGALCAMAQRSLRRFAAFATTASGGLCVLGIGGLTSQGLTGAVAGVLSHGLAAAILLAIASAFERRLKTSELTALAGVGQRARTLGVLLGVALAASFGLPLSAGFWGLLLVLQGALATQPALAFVAAGTFVVSAAAHLRVARVVFSGAAPSDRPIVDATPWELAALVPLAVALLLLGVSPAAWLSASTTRAHEISAVAAPVVSTPGDTASDN